MLQPERLTSVHLMAAYQRRWTMDRMYLPIKAVLELNRPYNCSPASVGQKVFATAILYNTPRNSQTQLAATAGVAPGILAVDKLFRTLIDHQIKATCIALGAEVEWQRVRAEHRRVTRPEAPVDPL